jgi:hypothetical protein
VDLTAECHSESNLAENPQVFSEISLPTRPTQAFRSFRNTFHAKPLRAISRPLHKLDDPSLPHGYLPRYRAGETCSIAVCAYTVNAILSDRTCRAEG